MTPEELAQRFHEAYETLAPSYRYKTREASAVPWADVPSANKQLMIAVAGEILNGLSAEISELPTDIILESGEVLPLHVSAYREGILIYLGGH